MPATFYRISGEATEAGTGARRRLSGACWTTGDHYSAMQRVHAEAEERGLMSVDLVLTRIDDWPSNLPSGRTVCLRTRKA